MNWIEVLVISIASALITLTVISTWVRLCLIPSLQKDLDREFQQKLETATRVLSAEVEESVHRGFLQGVSDIPSAEVLRDTSKTLARTSARIVGAGLDALAGKDS